MLKAGCEQDRDAVGRCMPADSARPPGGGGAAAADVGTETGGNSGAASVVNGVGAAGRQRLPTDEQSVQHAYASLQEANTVALDAEHLGGGVDAVVEVRTYTGPRSASRLRVPPPAPPGLRFSLIRSFIRQPSVV